MYCTWMQSFKLVYNTSPVSGMLYWFLQCITLMWLMSWSFLYRQCNCNYYEFKLPTMLLPSIHLVPVIMLMVKLLTMIPFYLFILLIHKWWNRLEVMMRLIAFFSLLYKIALCEVTRSSLAYIFIYILVYINQYWQVYDFWMLNFLSGNQTQ